MCPTRMRQFIPLYDDFQEMHIDDGDGNSSESESAGEEDAEDDGATTCDYYTATENDFVETSITNWYQNPELQRLTIPTALKQLPPSVVNYLVDGTFNLPKGAELSGVQKASAEQDGANTTDSSTEDSADSTDPEDNALPIKEFLEFEEFISNSVEEFGDAVFPKVNWFAPLDAAWIAFNKSLKCALAGDVYLLLKCSKQITDLLDKSVFKAFYCDLLPPPSLVLRKWMDIPPDQEFRCFVMNSRLTAISQRDKTATHGFMREEELAGITARAIVEDIQLCFQAICEGFKELKYYVFDVVRLGPKNVVLIDFNVFGWKTDPCLFTYSELKDIADEMAKPDGVFSEHSRYARYPNIPGTEKYGNPVLKVIDHNRLWTPRLHLNIGPSDIEQLPASANQ